ncbi:hypothetical protein D3C84_324740 [compost metagenome]
MKLFVFVDIAERFEVSPFFETQSEAIEWANRTWDCHQEGKHVDLIEVGSDSEDD